jgi:hypothetical protein
MKKELIKIFRIAIFALTGWIFWIKYSIRTAEERDKYEEPLFQNNLVIKGIIDEISNSGNHCFNILYLKKFTGTLPYFNPYRNKKDIFPYAIKNGNCEIYSWACVYDAKPGDSIIIDSNKRSVMIITKDTLNNVRGNLTFVGGELGYIKEHSKLKFQ